MPISEECVGRFLSASHHGLGTASTSLPIVDVAWRSRRARAGCGNSQHANSCRAPIGQETQRQRIAAHARRLNSLQKSISEKVSPVGKVFPLCADLTKGRLPFGPRSFSAIICNDQLTDGGHLFIETFGGHGHNSCAIQIRGKQNFAWKCRCF